MWRSFVCTYVCVPHVRPVPLEAWSGSQVLWNLESDGYEACGGWTSEPPRHSSNLSSLILPFWRAVVRNRERKVNGFLVWVPEKKTANKPFWRSSPFDCNADSWGGGGGCARCTPLKTKKLHLFLEIGRVEAGAWAPWLDADWLPLCRRAHVRLYTFGN